MIFFFYLCIVLFCKYKCTSSFLFHFLILFYTQPKAASISSHYRIGDFINSSLSFVNVYSMSMLPLFSSSDIGCMTSSILGRNTATIPMTNLSSDTEVGSGSFSIARTPSLLGCILFFLIVCPKYLMWLLLNLHFSLLGFNPVCFIQLRTFHSHFIIMFYK